MDEHLLRAVRAAEDAAKRAAQEADYLATTPGETPESALARQALAQAVVLIAGARALLPFEPEAPAVRPDWRTKWPVGTPVTIDHGLTGAVLAHQTWTFADVGERPVLIAKADGNGRLFVLREGDHWMRVADDVARIPDPVGEARS